MSLYQSSRDLAPLAWEPSCSLDGLEVTELSPVQSLLFWQWAESVKSREGFAGMDDQLSYSEVRQ